jgi:outer membrane immunogenic protein
MFMTRSIATLAALALPVPALAGGMAVPEPEPVIEAPAPVVPASADWSGFYAGGQLGYGDIDSNGGGLDGYGWLGGVHGGYRWDLGATVLGIEADFDAADVDLGTAGDSLDNVARLKFSAGGEFGRTLVYATGGFAHASATVGGADLSDDGYFLGAGIGFALTDQWVVGGEILGHQFEDFDGSGVDLDATTVTARVSFNF